MKIRILSTIGELRALNCLEAFCALFRYDIKGVIDNSPVSMTYEQARKIGLPLPWNHEIQQLPTPATKRTRKAK